MSLLPVIGIRTRHLALAEVSLGSKNTLSAWSVQDRVTIETPLALALQNAIADTRSGIIKARKNAVIVIEEEKVFRKIVSISAEASLEERGEKVVEAVASYLPQPAAEMAIDFQVIPNNWFEEREKGMIQVVVAAVELAYINAILAITDAEKFSPAAIDTEAAALVRLFLPVAEKLPQLLLAKTDLGAVAVLSQRGRIWATALITAGDDLLAVLSADELLHVVKFYSNRSGKKDASTSVLLAPGSWPADFSAELEKESGLHVEMAKSAISFPEKIDPLLVLSLGGALFAEHARLPEVLS